MVQEQVGAEIFIQNVIVRSAVIVVVMFKYDMWDGWYFVCIYPGLTVSYSLHYADGKTPQCYIYTDIGESSHCMAAWANGVEWKPEGFDKPLGEVKCLHCNWFTDFVRDNCQQCGKDLYG